MKARIPHPLAVCLAVAFASTAAHANLLANGDFETGTFSGWTQFGNVDGSGVDGTAPHAGSFAAFFGPTPTVGGISQTVATVVGSKYAIDFWLQNEADVLGASQPNSFDFSWGGVSALGLVNSPASGYTHYTFMLTAAAASTEVKFTFRQAPAFWDLDDVAINSSVPEPSSSVLAVLGAGSLAMLRRRRRRA